MLKKRIASQITQAATRNLVANTDITFFGSGSIARTIVESMAREIELLYDTVDLNLSMSRLSTSAGAFIDIIASQFGLTRFGGSSGIVLAEDRAVRFFVRSGRLIDYMQGGTSLTTGIVPQGTTIANRDNSIRYKVSSNTSFPASAISVYVPVEPENSSAGSRNNIGNGGLVRHSLGNPNILVENVAPMIVGSDPETDDELRLRISRHINSRSPGSRTAVLEAAFSFPGVSDIRIRPFDHGAGSFEVLIVPTGSKVAQNIIENIKGAVDSVVPYGIRTSVRGPDLVSIGLVAQVVLGRGILNTTKAVAIDASRRAIREYIGDIPMGGELIINRLRSVILDSDSNIRDLKILDLIIDCRPQVIANWQLNQDEVFVLDEKLPQPLLVI